MTATEQYVQMQALVNEPYNDVLLTSEASLWLSKAQRAVFNDAYYNRRWKEKGLPAPPSSFQSNHYLSELLAPVEVESLTHNQTDGWLGLPFDLSHLTAVYVVGITGQDCNTEEMSYEVREVSDNEYATRKNNQLLTPVWEKQGINPLYWHRPIYTWLTKNGVRGIKIEPVKENGNLITYNVFYRYLSVLPDIKVASTQLELQSYNQFPNPNFTPQAVDINPVLPDFIHDEIVEWATRFFLESIGNEREAQVKQQTIERGVV